MGDSRTRRVLSALYSTAPSAPEIAIASARCLPCVASHTSNAADQRVAERPVAETAHCREQRAQRGPAAAEI